MLQRVVLNRPGLWSAVSTASVFTSRPSSYLTNSLGKLFPQGQRISKPLMKRKQARNLTSDFDLVANPFNPRPVSPPCPAGALREGGSS